MMLEQWCDVRDIKDGNIGSSKTCSFLIPFNETNKQTNKKNHIKSPLARIIYNGEFNINILMKTKSFFITHRTTTGMHCTASYTGNEWETSKPGTLWISTAS